jgi:DNA (cytosine-5)-methyltransferase 1
MESMPTQTPARLRAVDLFCGAGGLSVGLKEAGFEICLAIDHDEAAAETYARNIGPHVKHAEIGESLAVPAAAIIAGGPPCQGFSSAGPRRVGDHRNSLVGAFAEIVARHRPRAFIFENVEGFLTAEGGRRVFELLEPLVAAGYRIHLRKISAANYGVPQHRKRVLAIGGLGWDPLFPTPTHRAFGAPGASIEGRNLPRARTLGDAFKGLPPAVVEPGSPTVADHTHRMLTEDDLVRVRALQQGQTMRDLPEELWHDSYRRRAHRRVMDGTPCDRRGGPPAGVRRLRLDEPSKAITGGARSEFVHPTEDRYLTIRECARIQTFPDDFEFSGTAAERALQIGNAVPPLLASLIGTALLEDLERPQVSQSVDGALLSFVPTVSDGMSPALQKLTTAVRERFEHRPDHHEQLVLWR